MFIPAFIALFIGSFLLSLLACRLIKHIGPSIGLVDKPGARKLQQVPIPSGGGLGIWFGVMTPLVLLTILTLGLDGIAPDGTVSVETSTLWGRPLTDFPSILATHIGGIHSRLPQLWLLLGLASVLTLLGTLDDRFNLPWKLRLLVEFVVATVAVCNGWRATFFVDMPILTSIISIFWIVGLVNSFNMLDNMDALSGGVATICSFFLAAVALSFSPNSLSGEPQYFLGGFLVLLMGAICGFLTLNRPPAKMYMGDGGAYFIGFLLAILSLSITFVSESTPKTAIFVPLCIMAVPLYDTISVVIIRLRNGRSPFEGDRNHYSHRLVALGLSKPQAVATIYLTTAICGTGAFLLYQVRMQTAILIFTQTALVLSLVAILEFAARKKIREQEREIEEQKYGNNKVENAKS